MSLIVWSGRVAAIGALLLSASAAAQRPGEVTLFSEIGFRGRSITFNESRQNIRLGWTVRSARASPGEAWEICSRHNFQGQCNRLLGSAGNVGWTVHSLRPTRAVAAPTDDRSLRGMTAEFFPGPSDRNGRVTSCLAGTAACAADSADRFCRSRGWTASAHERQQSIGGRNYLADVLCTYTGRQP